MSTSQPQFDFGATRQGTRKHERTWVQRFWASILIPLFSLIAKKRYHNLDAIPRKGPIVVVSNHVSELDPIVIAIAVWKAKRAPHFMAKAGLFRIPVIGRILTATGQIPVERSNGGPMAMRQSERILNEGEVIIVYPEGTLTREPDLWPMMGKTGAVRLAWENSVPLIPVVQWGTQHILGRYSSKFNWLPPRKRIDILVGEPVDLSEFAGMAPETATLERATEKVMLAVTAELEKLRGPKPTPELWRDMTVPKSELSPVEKVATEARS